MLVVITLFLWLFILCCIWGRKSVCLPLSACLSGGCGSFSTLFSTLLSSLGSVPGALVSLLSFSTLILVILWAHENPTELLSGLDTLWMSLEVAVRVVVLPLLALFRTVGGLLVPLWNFLGALGGLGSLIRVSLECSAEDTLDASLHLLEGVRLFLLSCLHFLGLRVPYEGDSPGGLLGGDLDLRGPVSELSLSAARMESNVVCVCKSLSPLARAGLYALSASNLSSVVHLGVNAPIHLVQELLLFLSGNLTNFTRTHEGMRSLSLSLGFYLDEVLYSYLGLFWEGLEGDPAPGGGFGSLGGGDPGPGVPVDLSFVVRFDIGGA
jgi:hypothetical protein